MNRNRNIQFNIRLTEAYARKGIEFALQQKTMMIKNTAPAKTIPKKKLRR